MAVIALVVHPDRAAAADLANRASMWLEERGHEVSVPPPSAVGEWYGADARPMAGDTDLAVSLGGDGTMLRTVELAAPAGVPVLGVNLGHLGYLTEVEPDHLLAALDRFLSGDYGVEERMTLEVELQPGPSGAGDDRPAKSVCLALNEAVLEKSNGGHTIRLGASISGRPFITYAADGLIVATPTGSTAYNLSARGPIVSPRLKAVIVTPVSPHMLFDRPLVLEPSEQVRLEVMDNRTAVLVVDGSVLGTLSTGDAIVCRAGAHAARLVTFSERDFHAILKAKFSLGQADPAGPRDEPLR
ncbi:MAG: NAD(+)/NADH kinase [Acidimicrobiales bacterium]